MKIFLCFSSTLSFILFLSLAWSVQQQRINSAAPACWVKNSMTVQHKAKRSQPPHISSHHRQPDPRPEIHHRRLVSLQAGVAEMMLVNRLRAHTRGDLALDTLQRGAKIIATTANHWFADKGRCSDAPSNLESSAVAV